MRKLIVSLLIGIIAGLIDVTPMLLQHLDASACLSAFIHWVVLGVIIAYISAPMAAWLKGCLVGVFASLSIIVLVAQAEPMSAVPILIFSTLIGSLVGWATARYAP